MKLWQCILLVVLLVALPVMSGCGSEISREEAIAIVVEYENSQPHNKLFQVDYRSIGTWDAEYQGKGHWVVTCTIPLSYSDPTRGAEVRHWNYFENSGIVGSGPTIVRDGDEATLLRNDDGDSVALLCHADGSPVA